MAKKEPRVACDEASGEDCKHFETILPVVAGTQLTPCQQQALAVLSPILRGEQPGARASLQGPAGTGKTFTTARLVAQAIECIPGAQGERNAWGGWVNPPAVLLAAPTHKACRQLERALAGYGVQGVQAVTLHAALGLRPRRSEDREWFEPDPRAPQLVGTQTRLVVVDEASMVSRALVRLLLAVLPADAALVAIGDPCQLQPVKDPGRSVLFDLPIQARLDQVVRHQGPVLQLATATRQLGTGRPRFEALAGEQSAVITHRGFHGWYRAALQGCIAAARAGDVDGARMLAWANTSVQKFNRDVHAALYGSAADPYVVGQPVVSHDCILGPDGKPLVSSTCEMVLQTVEPNQGRIPGDELQRVRETLLGKRRTKAGDQLPPWRWWALQARIQGEDRTIAFEVLDPDCRKAWSAATKAIGAAAKATAAEQGKHAAKALWGLYWSRRDRFGQISPVWGLTIHKSQGATFRRVFLHPDLDRNPAAAQRNQLAYVGISRASQALHVVGDPPPPPDGEGIDQEPVAVAAAGGGA